MAIRLPNAAVIRIGFKAVPFLAQLREIIVLDH